MSAQFHHLLFIKEGISAGSTYPLEVGKNLLGCALGCVLLIGSLGVSQSHPCLLLQHNHHLIKNLVSSEWLFMNEALAFHHSLLNNRDDKNFGLDPGLMCGSSFITRCQTECISGYASANI